jgi:hypothetical protein
MSQKYCSKCGITKSVEQFGKNSSRSDGFQTYCKKCRNDHQRTWYADSEHKKLHIVRVKKNKQDYKNEVQAVILGYLSEHPCVDCGNDDLEVLDFDHIDPNSKFDSVSNMMRRGFPVERIIEEIKKCQIRCANCHRKRTIRQFGWYRLLEK